MYEQVEQLVKSGVEMEEALLAKTADGEEMEARIETLARTATEAQEAMAAQEKVAAALQAAELFVLQRSATMQICTIAIRVLLSVRNGDHW